MDILLNELSIDGQFASDEEFAVYLREKLVSILQVIDENDFYLLKKSDIYNCKITPDKTLLEILYQANMPVFTVLKVYISQLCAEEPYWDDAAATDLKAGYCYQAKHEEPNCFTEAIERKVPMLSFPHSGYDDKKFVCAKNDEQVVVTNIQNIAGLLTACLEKQTLAIDYIIEKYPYSTEISLVRIDGKCYAKEALENNALTIGDFQKIVRDIERLIGDLRAGTKTDLWDSLGDGLFEFREKVSSDRIFRLFFIQDGGIQFLNGFIKKTMKTPSQEKDKAKEIRKKLKKT